jgi:hypothetical protein
MVMKISGMKFEAGRIDVDGGEFENCIFNGTVLVYSGGLAPKFSHCAFNSANWFFGGAAGNTIALLRDLHTSPFRPVVEQMLKFLVGEINLPQENQ